MSTTVQTIVEQTKAATLFLKVTIENYQKKVESVAPPARKMVTDAVRKVGDTAVGLVKSAKHATHKLNVYSDNMYLIETFNGHLKTVSRKIGKKALLFQKPTAPFENLADNIIDQARKDHEWHTLRAEIIALKDFRDLAMEGSQPKSTRLIAYLKDKVNAGQLTVINAVRNAFGYAPIVLENLKVDDDDEDPAVMTDLDVIHNMVAIAFDPFDATNLHNVGITRPKLKEEIVKMLKMVYASYKTAIATDGQASLFGQIDIVKRADFSMKQLSKVYTGMLTEDQDPGPLLNQIVELMRNANMTTRNTMDLVKEGLKKILHLLPTGSVEAQEARDQITRQLAQMELDKTDWGGKFMSQRFKHDRIPPIIKALTKYVLSLKGSDHYKNIQKIITEYNEYIEQIRTARGEIYEILASRKLVPYLGTDQEAYQVFITYIIHNFIPTRAFPGAFTETGTILNMVFGEDNNNNNNWNSDEEEEDDMDVELNHKVEQEMLEAQGVKNDDSNSGNASGNNKGHISMNEVEMSEAIKNSNEEGNDKRMNNTGNYSGGKRKQTRKRSSKKSKKSKKTKRMKKVKRTMKKNKGKKGKKASRKRR